MYKRQGRASRKARSEEIKKPRFGISAALNAKIRECGSGDILIKNCLGQRYIAVEMCIRDRGAKHGAEASDSMEISIDW